MPKIIWHGFDNQYHIWVSRAFLLNFGTSINDGQPVVRKVYQALRWTLVINLLAIVVGYTLAILIGTYAGWKGGIFDTISNIILTGFYAIPVFWLATILVVFFTTSEYGNWTNIFPAAGIWKTDIGNTFTQIIRQNASLLIIPVLTLSTSLMAYIARIMRNSVIEEKNKSYVIHARVKGLSDRVILWKHVFRNASFPLITLLASVLPAAIAGSLVVEVICSIPGSGRLLFEAILDQEWAIVSAVVMISSLLTILGLLISDILYRLVDPRVKWDTL
jgi:peptide/nickel transport system permease protein